MVFTIANAAQSDTLSTMWRCLHSYRAAYSTSKPGRALCLETNRQLSLMISTGLPGIHQATLAHSEAKTVIAL